MKYIALLLALLTAIPSVVLATADTKARDITRAAVRSMPRLMPQQGRLLGSVYDHLRRREDADRLAAQRRANQSGAGRPSAGAGRRPVNARVAADTATFSERLRRGREQQQASEKGTKVNLKFEESWKKKITTLSAKKDGSQRDAQAVILKNIPGAASPSPLDLRILVDESAEAVDNVQVLAYDNDTFEHKGDTPENNESQVEDQWNVEDDGLYLPRSVSDVKVSEDERFQFALAEALETEKREFEAARLRAEAEAAKQEYERQAREALEQQVIEERRLKEESLAAEKDRALLKAEEKTEADVKRRDEPSSSSNLPAEDVEEEPALEQNEGALNQSDNAEDPKKAARKARKIKYWQKQMKDVSKRLAAGLKGKRRKILERKKDRVQTNLTRLGVK